MNIHEEKNKNKFKNMRTLSKILGILMITAVISSCSNEKNADAYGNFEDDALVVSAEGVGKILEFSIEDGQEVKKQQIIAVIDTVQLHLKKEILIAGKSTIDSKVRNVEAQKLVLNEQLNSLKINQKRIQKMFNDGAATQKQLDDINSQLIITEQKIKNITTQSQSVVAEKKSLDAQVQQLNDLIKKNIIKSPINGTVLETFVKQGEFAAPGKPLCSLQNTKNLTLRAYVSETQLSQIKLNQKVKIEVDFGDTTTTKEGLIYWISAKAEFTPKQIQTKEERKNLVYAIKIKVGNKDGVYKIGMPANVEF